MPDWHFIRHGESRANAEGWFAGTHDVELTEIGMAQARQARQSLAGVLVDRAFSSDLSRARSTAEILLANRRLPLQTTPELRERCCGDWEQRAIVDIEASGEMDVFLGWNTRPPNGESLEEVALRALRWLAEIDDGRSHTLLVAHGALMRAVIGAVDRLPRSHIGLFRPKNCELVTRSLQPGSWRALLEELEEARPGSFSPC